MEKDNRHIEKVKNTLIDFFAGVNVKIILFGSRTSEKGKSTSDIDIGILPEEHMDMTIIRSAREKMESLNIPLKIDMVNLSEVSQSFAKTVFEEGTIWKN